MHIRDILVGVLLLLNTYHTTNVASITDTTAGKAVLTSEEELVRQLFDLEYVTQHQKQRPVFMKRKHMLLWFICGAISVFAFYSTQHR